MLDFRRRFGYPVAGTGTERPGKRPVTEAGNERKVSDMRKQRIRGMVLAGAACLALGLWATRSVGTGPEAGKGRLAAVEAVTGKVFRERMRLPEAGTFLVEAETLQEETVQEETVQEEKEPGQTAGAEMAMTGTGEKVTPVEGAGEGDAETEGTSSSRTRPAVSEAAETPPVEQTAGSTGDHSSAGSSGNTGESSFSGDTSGEGTPGQPVHIHTWEEQTTTVVHEAAGHYETRVIREAWEEPVYAYRLICNACGTDVTEEGVRAVHYAFECGGGWSDKKVLTGTIRHEAETGQVWVEDLPAWTETVGTGTYKCSSCGAVR